MMALLGLSTLASLVVSLVLGVRLMRLWSRTRQFPELAIGASFLIAGVFGFVATVIGNPGVAGLSDEAAYLVMVTGIALISIGVLLNFAFVWKVFRPDSRWAKALVVLAGAALLGTIVPISGGGTGSTQVSFLTILGDLVRFGSGAWGAFESLRYFSLMRRRMRLGLADPAVTNRFLLWGLASLSTATIFLAASTFARVALSPQDGGMTLGLMMYVATFTIVTASCQWLAFLPPARYTAWIASRPGHGAAA